MVLNVIPDAVPPVRLDDVGHGILFVLLLEEVHEDLPLDHRLYVDTVEVDELRDCFLGREAGFDNVTNKVLDDNLVRLDTVDTVLHSSLKAFLTLIGGFPLLVVLTEGCLFLDNVGQLNLDIIEKLIHCKLLDNHSIRPLVLPFPVEKDHEGNARE
ncbi:hypothetical protein [Flavonifractor plautii]|uniref:hypothetical protein n=1 Tax=Flavonifractor plautii TaxID=292800 RepID=UPI001FABC2A7|nr:hypothetical protein [Flavonifractor plautii]